MDELVAVSGGVDIDDGVDPRIPDDLFSFIVGHGAIKRRLLDALAAPEPVSIMLCGEPGTAKSIFLSELARIPGNHLLVGDQFSRAGLLDLLLGPTPPRLLLIDEMDKVRSDVGKGGLEALLTITESGLVTRTQGDGRVQQAFRSVSVVATVNSVRPFDDAMLRRFWKLRVRAYSLEERLAVISGFLVQRHHIDPEHALAIAALVAPKSGDVTQARHVANLYGGDLRRLPELVSELDDWEATEAAERAKVTGRRKRPVGS